MRTLLKTQIWRKILFGIGILPLFCVHAEYKEKPDANTLWREDGKNIQHGNAAYGKGWNDSRMEITALPNGEGFNFTSNSFKQNSTGRQVPVNRNYPWLSIEITASSPTKDAYKSCYANFSGNDLLAISKPEPGIWLQRIWDGTKAAPKSYFYMVIHGYSVDFKCIQVIKEPENWIRIDSDAFASKKCFENGDTLVFTAKLAAPAEDVSVKFFDTYNTPNQVWINGKDEISLKPANEEKTLWKTEVKIESIKGGNPKFRRKLIFKCIVLGGKLKKPIFINNPFPYKAPPKNAK